MPGFHPRGCRKEDLADAGLEKNLPEPRRSKGVRNILTRGRAFAPSSRLASREPDSATAPAARDSATAPDSPPSLPARAQPPLALEKGMFSASSSPPRPHPLLPPLLLSRFPLLEFQVHRGSRRPHRFLPVWRETVATPGPEVRISSSQYPSPPLVLLEHASTTLGCLNC
jgi:hypothetical protein